MYKEIDSNKRKTIVMFLVFAIFMIGIGWLFSYLLDSYGLLVLAVIISVIQALVGYYYSDKIALNMSGAEKAERKEPYLGLHRIIENMAITAGLPKPQIYVINDPAPNAFATGRDPKHASLAVTKGLLEIMNEEELKGVIAHEMSHVGNYDIRVMTIAVVLVGAIALISDFFMRSLWFRDRDSENKGQAEAILMIAGIILAILAPIAATMIQLAVSRKREYLADASGALLTRYPEGLASALEKLKQYSRPMIHRNRATAHMFIANPLEKIKAQTWFSTHPPIDDRIKKLRAMIGS